MKTKRKVAFFLALMSLIYCLTFMQDTYAKYISSATEQADLTIARWSILVNNQDVVNQSNFSDTISPVFAGTTNIRSDVIAPTSEGYFELIINGSNTDVSFSYNISLDTTDCDVEDLIITSYTLNGTTYTYNGSNITGNILLSDANRTATLRFNVKWNDDAATEQMNNAADTAASVEGTANVHINLSFIQKASN